MSRTAFITGAAGGIGRALARRFRADGYVVVLADVNPDVESFAAELGGRSEVIDVGDEAAVNGAIARLTRLDVLICNAGISANGNWPASR